MARTNIEFLENIPEGTLVKVKGFESVSGDGIGMVWSRKTYELRTGRVTFVEINYSWNDDTPLSYASRLPAEEAERFVQDWAEFLVRLEIAFGPIKAFAKEDYILRLGGKHKAKIIGYPLV